MAMMRQVFLLLLLCSVLQITQSLLADKPVSQLLQQHSSNIEKLKEETKSIVGSIDSEPYSNDVFYLRYCLECETPEEQSELLSKNLSWRQGQGRSICDSAVNAVQEATASGGWTNDPVLKSAPHSAFITKYITPSNVITTTNNKNDLVYCIRAGQIDDNALMDAVSVDQMTEFFLYAKEVNALVSNQRSLDSDKLVALLTVNDLSGVKLVGGSADFRLALSASSKQANDLYPTTNGPTLLLNLPRLLNALVKLFTPLFPPAVNKRLKFARGPLKDVDSLEEIKPGGPKREEFLQELEAIVYE